MKALQKLFKLLLITSLLLTCTGNIILAQPRPSALNAGPATAALLRYLDDVSKHDNCLLGQAVDPNGVFPDQAAPKYKDLVANLYQQTGRSPVVLEYVSTFSKPGNRINMEGLEIYRNEIVKHWREGHIIYMRLRVPHPVFKDHTHKVNDLSEVYLPEGQYYNAYRDDLAYVADYLKTLEEEGVVLLLELFNEFTGDWNWFGRTAKDNPEQFKMFWRFTYDYFAKERNLSNLLFVLEYNKNSLWTKPAVNYYPGDEYVDILGLDNYSDDPKDEYLSLYNQLLALGKPVALTEYGPDLAEYRKEHNLAVGQAKNVWDNMIQLDFTKTYYPRFCFFIRWGDDWAIVHQLNTASFMADSFWIDRAQFKLEDPLFSKPGHSSNKPNTIYPNPVQSIFHLDLPPEFSGKRLGIEILNSEGSVVRSDYFKVFSNRIEMNISSLPVGMYFCRVSAGQSLAISKFIRL